MRKLLIAITFILAALGARAAHVTFTFDDFSGMHQPYRTLYVYPTTNTCVNSSGGIMTMDRKVRVTGTNGSVTISNMLDGVCGCYRVELQGAYTTTTNWICLPVTNGLINAADWIGPINGPNQTVGYSQSQADNRFIRYGDNKSGGVGILTNFSSKALSILEAGTNNWAALTNGQLWIPPSYVGGVETNVIGNPGGIFFGKETDTAPNQNGRAWYILNLVRRGSGSAMGELLLSHNNLALEEQNMGYIILGNDGSSGGKIIIEYDDNFGSTLSPGGPVGHSKALIFSARTKDGGGTKHWTYPSIVAQHGGDYTDSVGSDPQSDFGVSGLGTLGFYTATPFPQQDGTLAAGILGFRMETNGTTFRGGIYFNRASNYLSSSTFAIDLATNTWLDVVLNASSVTFSTIDAWPGATNVQQLTLFVHAGAGDRTVTWPAWRVISGSAPSSLTAFTGLKVVLYSIGSDTNILAEFGSAYSELDTDAAAFITRASITDATQKAAIQSLVSNAKAHGWWVKCDAIYPFVGGAATPHSKNLIANTFNITWNGSVTHNANGVTGDGSTGYGDTGFIPNIGTHLYTLNSSTLAVYSGTQSPTDQKVVIGSFNSTADGLLINTTSWTLSGLNSGTFAASSYFVSSDFRKMIMGTRTGASAQAMYSNGSSPLTSSGASTSLDNVSIYVLARNAGAADRISNCNLRFALIGGAFNDQNALDCYNDVQAFETILGRAL